MTDTRLLNRELSWLEFNRRVLEEAQDGSVPLLERVKFLAIVSSNLDEFFMVRVAELRRRLRDGDDAPGPDGLRPSETLAAIAERARQLSAEQHRCFLDQLEPLLAAEGIRLVGPKDLTDAQAAFLHTYFEQTLLPVVTPLAIDPAHPFPYLANRSLCLLVALAPTGTSPLPPATLSVVHIPSHVLPRFLALPDAPGQHVFIRLEDAVRAHLPRLYEGYEIRSAHTLRVTRDAEVRLSRTPDDLLESIEEGLRGRRMGSAVRLQYDGDLPADVLTMLVDELELEHRDLYEAEGFIAFSDLFQLYAAIDEPALKDRPLRPHPVPEFETAPDVWSAIRAGDILVHHPYHSFDAVTRFVHDAAVDPRVLAIKMTLYRVSPRSPIAQALTLAAERGKEVAVLVELQARFDEEANITWARALEAVGAHVVYGIVGYKTHCKACLVVREEPDGIRRYCHVATGNYNVRTAGIYSDIGLFTARPSFGEDLTELFNLLTGYTRPRRFQHLLVAPTGLRDALLARIRREADHARAGRAGAHRAQDEQPRGSGADRGALRGGPRRREHRPDRARHLLPAPRRARAVRQHPRHVDRRPLPRARADLPLRQRRRRGVPARLGGLDAAQPRSPRRDRVPGPRRESPGAAADCPHDAARRHRQGPAAARRRPLRTPRGRRTAPALPAQALGALGAPRLTTG